MKEENLNPTIPESAHDKIGTKDAVNMSDLLYHRNYFFQTSSHMNERINTCNGYG